MITQSLDLPHASEVRIGIITTNYNLRIFYQQGITNIITNIFTYKQNKLKTQKEKNYITQI